MKISRKNLFIYPGIQKKIIAHFIMAGAIGFVGIGLGTYLFSQQLFETLVGVGALQTPESQLALNEAWTYFSIYMVIFGVLYTLALSLLGLFFSHRLVGPLIRVRESLSGMIESDQFEELSVRDTDFLSDVVSELNQSIQKRQSKR